MKKFMLVYALLILCLTAIAQQWKGKFEQLDYLLPTPNTYRTASGAPGPAYWQQRADYEIDVEINDYTQVLTGKEIITYFNNSPETLTYLWVQLDQNINAPENSLAKTRTYTIRDSVPTRFLASALNLHDYKGATSSLR